MTDKQPYSYVVLRYVHDVVTGEFINVGVVLHVPSRKLFRAKTRTTISRIKAVFPDLDRKVFQSAMRSVQRGIQQVSKEIKADGFLADEGDAKSFACKALPPDDSSLQWSPVGTGLTDDADRTFDRLFGRFIASYDTQSKHRRTDNDVWRPVREKIEERKIPITLEEKIVDSPTDEIAFKHAWKNGRWHAYEPVSFDLVDADGIKSKARRWRGHLAAVADGAHEQIKLHFVLGTPQNTQLMPAYKSAVEILRRAPFKPEIFEESEIDDLVSKIEDEVRAHKHSRR